MTIIITRIAIITACKIGAINVYHATRTVQYFLNEPRDSIVKPFQ